MPQDFIPREDVDRKPLPTPISDEVAREALRLNQEAAQATAAAAEKHAAQIKVGKDAKAEAARLAAEEAEKARQRPAAAVEEDQDPSATTEEPEASTGESPAPESNA